MFSLVLVDDEEFALQGLCNYVDWESMGFFVCGTAHTIAEAKALLNCQKVDAILTDIQLEQESGLDLVREVQAARPDICCIILSGHGEFEYARQALQYSAFDFLTKPVQFDMLRSTFEKVLQHLSAKQKEKSKQAEYYELKRTTFFNNIAKEDSGFYDANMARELGVQTAGSMQLFRVRFFSDRKLSHLLCDAKKMECPALSHAFANVACEVFNNTLNEYAVLVYNCCEEVLIDRLKLFSEQCTMDMVAGVSLPFCALSQLGRAYYEAGKALDYQLVKRGCAIVMFSSVQNNLYVDHILPEPFVVKANECLSHKDVKALQTVVQKELETLAQYSDSQNIMYSFCVELILLVERFLHSYGAEMPGSFVGDSVHQVILRNTPKDITQCMQTVLNNVSQQIETANPYSSDVVKDIKAYIAEHYAEDISLQSLAEQFYLHPIYLSKLFKEKTGENFIDYLTHMRISNAKKLLKRTDIRIYDISQMVGYESPKYFSRLFKELIGTTPKEYRECEQQSS